MATSGTVGRTVIDATAVIEHATRRCGVLTTELTAEMQTSAKDNLFLILSDFVTKGMELWCLGKVTYPVLQGASILNLDVGWVDVEHALLRTVSSHAADAIVAGSATYAPAVDATIVSAVLDLPAGDYSWVLEGSSDGGVTWGTYGQRAVSLAARQTICVDADVFTSLLNWRVAETLTGTVVPFSATFCDNWTEIPMSKTAQDDYAQLPNKGFPGRPLQFWFDKQRDNARFWLWPVGSDSVTYQCVVWGHRQIEDVGELSNTLDVPQRWMNAVISTLAPYICLELPKDKVPPGRLQELIGMAAAILKDVQDAEIDGAPVSIAPNISAYTR